MRSDARSNSGAVLPRATPEARSTLLVRGRSGVPASRRKLQSLFPCTYVAEAEGEVVGMVTLCTFRTLTAMKAYLDHLVV